MRLLRGWSPEQKEITPGRDNETPNPVALALWAIFNTQNSAPVLPVELQRLLTQSSILQKAPVECGLASLLPGQADIESLRVDLDGDRNKIDEIFTRFGQPQVPLVATYEQRHVLVSTAYSKSVLRVAAEEVAKGSDSVYYFPSYEIITGNHAAGHHFEPDRCSVT